MSLRGTPFKPARTARGIIEKAATLEKRNIYEKNKFLNFVMTIAAWCCGPTPLNVVMSIAA